MLHVNFRGNVVTARTPGLSAMKKEMEEAEMNWDMSGSDGSDFELI